ncbi:HAD family phosphatase [Oscillatoria sp. FACHB-1407]|uniref:HAD family hydrolase n=1 Tax=Oscillatoria sp. FACHB-1407 TaxID=2692847 RepID=UPI001685E669|nr:HAD family phosphatase [Oscillatoria sp. FACHB-1407]MBD2461033.1 HAD family phosphatase [Oscillatoria sp. FACHB-1407]
MVQPLVNLKALLFDLDGTIADTDPIHFQTWKAVLQEYGVEIDRPFYQAKFSGRLNPAIVKDVLPQLSAEEGQAVSDRKEADFRQRATQLLTPMPGLMEVLTWMEHQQFLRAIVTNAPVENAQFMLQTLKLEAIFPLVVLGQELPRGKPDPMPYQVALERLGVTAEEAIAFEDSPSGIRSAVAAGIPTVGVASTHAPEELEALGTVLVVADFTDPRLLDHLQISARSM